MLGLLLTLALQDPAPSKDVYESWDKYLNILKSRDADALQRFVEIDREYIPAHAHRWIKAFIRQKAKGEDMRTDMIDELLDAFAKVKDFGELEKKQVEGVRARRQMAEKMSRQDARRYAEELQRLDRAVDLEKEDKNEQARAEYEAHLKAMREFGDSERLLYAMGFVIPFYEGLNERPKALETAREMRECARKIAEPRKEFSALSFQETALRHLNRWEEVLECAAARRDLAVQANKVGTQVGVLLDMARACRHLHRGEEALKHAQAALECSKTRPEIAALAEPDILKEMAEADELLGRWDAAIDHLEKALKGYRDLKDADGEADVMNELGIVYDTCGRREKAREVYEQALKDARERNDRGAERDLLGNLGLVYHNLSRFHEAIRYSEEAIKLAREAHDRETEGQLLGNLGITCELIGQYDRAEQSYKAALAIARERADPKAESRALLNLGAFYQKTRKRKEALECNEQALALKRKLGDRFGEMQVTGNMGVLLHWEGRNEEAVRMLEASVAMAREFHRPVEEAESLMNLGRVRLKLGKPDDALPALESAVAIFKERGARLQEAIALSSVADVYLSQKKVDDSLKQYDRAIEALESVRATLGGMEAEKAAWMDWYRVLYENAIAARIKAGQFDEAVGLLEKMRSRNLLDALNRTESAWKDVPQELRAQKAELLREFNRQRREPKQDPRALQELEEKLRAVSHEIETRQNVEEARPLSAKEIRSCLGEGEALVVYTCLRPDEGEKRRKILVVMMTARGPIETFGLDPAEKLLDDVAWLGAAARASGSGFPAREFKARSAKMYDALLRPIEAALKKAGVRKLYIAPDEVLYQLPFEALAASDQGESYSELDYVGLRWTVQYVHSGTLLAVRRSRPGTSEGPVVVFGDPDYGSVKGADQRGGGPEKVPEDLKAYFKSEGERGGWSRLPFSREEAVEIAKLFGAEPKLGAKASEREVRAIRGARLLHFACHGTIDGSEPMRSALVLTADGEFDGYLEAREIAEMRVPCELAVLSACDSASGAVLRGEGLIGLTRAFLYAGARSVAASLWSVSDEGGKEFMIAFYKKLAAGQGKGEALAETKREFMRHAKYSAPYYWAGFVLYGE